MSQRNYWASFYGFFFANVIREWWKFYMSYENALHLLFHSFSIHYIPEINMFNISENSPFFKLYNGCIKFNVLKICFLFLFFM